MTVREAKATALEWAIRRAKEIPDFAGAYVHGSTCRRKDEDPFPSTSDIDLSVAVEGDGHDSLREVDGEYRGQAIEYRGVVMGLSHHSIKTFLDPERVLAHPGLASAFRTRNVLLDPTGTLARLHPVVSARYAQEKWVRARCAGQERLVRSGLDTAARVVTPLPGYADGFLEGLIRLLLAGLNGSAGIPCVADLGAGTTRRAFPNSREVLEAYGLQDSYGMLLEIAGILDVTETEANDFLAETERAFDLAVGSMRTNFWPGIQLFQPFLRDKVLGGARELIAEGSHREAMLFLAYLRTQAQNALENDAPSAVKAEMRGGHRRLLSALGIESATGIERKVELLRKLLPDLMAAAESIIRANPEIERV